MALITVTIPCYECNDTLPMALASLRAQTIDDWECVIVDDGSSRPVEPVVRRFDDRRIRLHSFQSNRGRPVARQKALEMARGDYICMLDADDWFYPDKLQYQLALIETLPDVAAVGTAVAVIDDEDRITGVRRGCCDDVQVRTGRPHQPPQLLFPGTMFRRAAAVDARFDPRLTRAEDPDYLMKVLTGRRYGVTSRIDYAYRETYSPQAVQEALEALRCQRITFGERLGRAPWRAGRQYLASLAKTALYQLALATGQGRWLFRRRNVDPTPPQRRRFRNQRRRIRQFLNHR